MPRDIALKELLEAGCHFGHRITRFYPKMKDFVYEEKDKVHIIDLTKTKECLEKAGEYVRNLISSGGQIIFVGTKRQARGIVGEEAERADVFYITERWLGGTLTNWEVIKKNLEKIKDIEEKIKNGEKEGLTKREIVLLQRKLFNLMRFYGGLVGLEEIPQALFVVDVKKEDNAVREAKKKGVAVVGIVDTNSNPEPINYVIPSNDDAVGAIKLITGFIADAAIEGKKLLKKKKE